MHLKFYESETVISFGRFKNSTIREVVDIDPSYIEWCICHLDHFLISENVTNYISKKYPNFKFSDNSKSILLNKEKIWCSDKRNYDENKLTYEKYSGSYAQDIERLSDDFIDDVLDGFPDAYWNID